MIGTSLNHYQITAKLGTGGIGEVYRARDTRLGRDVAIKVLPASLDQDRQYVSRFKREARLLALLNHPNIASLHSFEEHDGKHFLVLELVEGQTLEARLFSGPLSVAETLETCKQIALAIQAAHEKGIVHRDLKPANIKITSAGKVKLLDFGLAKALSQATSSPGKMEHTVSTVVGMVVGTPAYMSPEQLSGEPAGEQNDVWTFGCLVYECLTGKRLFGGPTITKCFDAVFLKDPMWSELPEQTPHTLRRLMQRCLERNPHRQRPTIGEVLTELENALVELRTARAMKPKRVSKRVKLAGIAIAVLLILAGVGWWLWTRSAVSG